MSHPFQPSRDKARRAAAKRQLPLVRMCSVCKRMYDKRAGEWLPDPVSREIEQIIRENARVADVWCDDCADDGEKESKK